MLLENTSLPHRVGRRTLIGPRIATENSILGLKVYIDSIDLKGSEFTRNALYSINLRLLFGTIVPRVLRIFGKYGSTFVLPHEIGKRVLSFNIRHERELVDHFVRIIDQKNR